jgi:hypothetical protein
MQKGDAYVTVQRKGIPPTGKAIATSCICNSVEEKKTGVTVEWKRTPGHEKGQVSLSIR